MWVISAFTLIVAILGGDSVRVPSSRSPQERHERHGPPGASSSSASLSTNVDCSSPANQVILHPHPTSCTLYLQCVHGSPMERPCAPGTEFSPFMGVCVHPWQSDCTAEDQAEEEQDSEPESASEAEPAVTNQGSESEVEKNTDKPSVPADSETTERREESENIENTSEKSEASENPETSEIPQKPEEFRSDEATTTFKPRELTSTIDVERLVSTKVPNSRDASGDTARPKVPSKKPFNYSKIHF